MVFTLWFIWLSGCRLSLIHALSLSFYITLCFASCYCSEPLSLSLRSLLLCFCFGFHFCFCFCFCSFALHSFAVIRRAAAATGLALLLFPQHASASPWSQRRGKHVNICHNWHKPWTFFSVCVYMRLTHTSMCTSVCVWACDNVGAHVRGTLCGRIEFISNSYVSFST